MLWVYYLDSKSDFRLDSHTRGSPPWYANSEAGSELVADDGRGVARSSREDYSTTKKSTEQLRFSISFKIKARS